MSIPTYNPQIQVLLRKTVRARSGVEDRFRGEAAVIDLSPYLGEGSSVSTQRGINQPAGGFSIRVGDRLYPAMKQVPGAVDSLYALVEPMDVIEIRMRRGAGSGKLPLVMRGLVSDVRSDEAMGGDGRPSRTVTITGQDWGKWLQIIQIKYLRGQPIKASLEQMTQALLETRYGIPYIIQPAGRFVESLINKVVNRHIRGDADDRDDSPLLPFLVDVSGADDSDVVSPIGMQSNPQGTMWTYLQQYGNLGPFYEVMIDDLEAGPTLIYRKPVHQKLGNTGGVFGDVSTTTHIVPAADVVSISSSRTDADVANWYFVRAPRSDLLTSIDQVLFSQTGGDLSTSDYPNSAGAIYGSRLMEVETQHGALLQGEKSEKLAKSQDSLTDYTRQQIKYLQDSNKDNVVFERGSMTCKGNEAIKPGSFFSLSRRGLVTDGYITSVTQTFDPFKAFVTSVQFIRGNGFYNRSKRDGSGRENPYRSLIGGGVY